MGHKCRNMRPEPGVAHQQKTSGIPDSIDMWEIKQSAQSDNGSVGHHERIGELACYRFYTMERTWSNGANKQKEN